MGYLVTTSGDGRITEQDTLQCKHCSCAILKKSHALEGAYCFGCGGPICIPCAKKAGCERGSDAFMRKIERSIRRQKFLSSLVLFVLLVLGSTAHATGLRTSPIGPAINIAQLPSVSLHTSETYQIKDGTSSSDCTVGGGTSVNLCYSTGSVWSILITTVASATTALALAVDPADCAANTFSNAIAANGNLTCTAIPNAATTATSANTASTIVARDGSGNFSAGTITASLTGTASLCTAFASDPSDCGANTFASAIAASGNLSCTSIPNAATTAVSTNTASTIVTRDASGNFAAGTITADLTGTASLCTALAANPTDCGANTFAQSIVASGNLTCAAVSLSTADTTGTLTVAKGGTGIASGTSGGILGFTGSTTIASSAALTNHAIVIGAGAGATPSTPVGLGTSTTVLHGAAAGDPSYSAVSLTADVTGTLPIANGGTGTTTGGSSTTAHLWIPTSTMPTAGAGIVLSGSGANVMSCMRFVPLLTIAPTKLAFTVSVGIGGSSGGMAIYDDADAGTREFTTGAVTTATNSQLRSATGLTANTLSVGTPYRWCWCDTATTTTAHGFTPSAGMNSSNFGMLNAYVLSVGTVANACSVGAPPTTTGAITGSGNAAVAFPIGLVSVE